MKILAFAATSSSKSINKHLVNYAASQLEGAEIEHLDISDYELPIFSEDKEAELGQPPLAINFINKISESDALIISFAEHNGSYTAAYKNIFDWASRVNPKVFQGKPIVMLSTSPGPGGAATVLKMATAAAPYFDGVVKASFSVPSFYENFDIEQGCIKNAVINSNLMQSIQKIMH